MYADSGLQPGNYSLHPDIENRLVMAGLARRWSSALPQIDPDVLNGLHAPDLSLKRPPRPETPQPTGTLITCTPAAPLARVGPCILIRVIVPHPFNGPSPGTFTVHDGINASGPLVLGPLPLSVYDIATSGAALTTGCFVAFSGAGSVDVLLTLP